MKQGNVVELKMQTTLCEGQKYDEQVHQCEFLLYDDKEENLCLILKSGDLTELSLDALYECRIKGSDEQLLCIGRIHKRYCSEAGKVVLLQITNGFYKISIK